MYRSFKLSEALLARAQAVIPGGTQTFSKSLTQYPKGVSPHYIERAEGSRVWDADGNEMIDFVSGLLSIFLGYNDPDVDAAVRAQLEKGVTFSLPNEIEIEVAETICELVPCAEMVRFGKNGSDATAGAVRAARGFTRRDHIAVCGYHGWQDWYIGSTSRDLGVPAATKALTHGFAYNDLESLEALFKAHPGKLAAVIMEPMTVVEPAPGFLEGVREMTRREGTLLVFDEIITGFRLARGGAQELFGVTPDLTTLGKALANGYPLSAVTGRADVMKILAEAFYSFTMGSEAVSLAAAKATLTKIKNHPVLETVHQRGRTLLDGVRALIDKHEVGDFIAASGHPTWSFLTISGAGNCDASGLKTLWMQEIIERGVLCLGTHNLTYAHSDDDINRLIAVYDEVFPILKAAVENDSLKQYLRCEPLVPLFKVR